MKIFLVSLLLIFAQCASVRQVNLKTGIGNELREDTTTTLRFSATIGPEVQFANGIKSDITYRHRITEFEANTLEHGIFINACVPLWTK